METNGTDPKSFWQTLPGIITASAGAITAITGLIIALNNLGTFSKGNVSTDENTFNSQEPTEIVETQGDSPATVGNKDSGEKSFSIQFSSSVIRVSNELRYEILESIVEPMSPGRSLIRLKIRCFNEGKYDFNFWKASFRLAIDDIPTPPSNDLNELVEGRSAMDGLVEFDVPDDAKNLLFLIYDGDQRIEIPIDIGGS